MTDLISRMGLLEDLSASCYDLDALTGITGDERKLKDAILQFPTVDAVPVVHARWIYSGDMDSDGNSQCYCSRCGAGDKHRADLKNFVPYCWKCGAKMDAKEER